MLNCAPQVWVNYRYKHLKWEGQFDKWTERIKILNGKARRKQRQFVMVIGQIPDKTNKQCFCLCYTVLQNHGHTTYWYKHLEWEGQFGKWRDREGKNTKRQSKEEATTVCVCHGAISKKIDGRGMCGRRSPSRPLVWLNNRVRGKRATLMPTTFIPLDYLHEMSHETSHICRHICLLRYISRWPKTKWPKFLLLFLLLSPFKEKEETA